MSYTPFLKGTYTPVLTSAGTVPTFTATAPTGAWTRVGRLIFFAVFMDNTAGGIAGAGANAVSLSLPFATHANSIHNALPGGTMHNGANEEEVYLEFLPGVSTVALTRQSSVIQHDAVTCADFNNAARQLSVYGFYRPVGT